MISVNMLIQVSFFPYVFVLASCWDAAPLNSVRRGLCPCLLQFIHSEIIRVISSTLKLQ